VLLTCCLLGTWLRRKANPVASNITTDGASLQIGQINESSKSSEIKDRKEYLQLNRQNTESEEGKRLEVMTLY